MLSRTRLILAALVFFVAAAHARADQTIVFFRHGEKPSGGYGQLTCQVLNRALAITNVLAAMYGRGSCVYAPNPADKVADPAGPFYYVRPHATIEPTAIHLGMSVNTHYGYSDV